VLTVDASTRLCEYLAVKNAKFRHMISSLRAALSELGALCVEMEHWNVETVGCRHVCTRRPSSVRRHIHAHGDKHTLYSSAPDIVASYLIKFTYRDTKHVLPDKCEANHDSLPSNLCNLTSMARNMICGRAYIEHFMRRFAPPFWRERSKWTSARSSSRTTHVRIPSLP
jgi:hypothetical protein